MIYIHGWYNAAYLWAREQGLAREEWIHVCHDRPHHTLAGREPGRFVCVYGWTFDGMADATDRGHKVEFSEDPGLGDWLGSYC